MLTFLYSYIVFSYVIGIFIFMFEAYMAFYQGYLKDSILVGVALFVLSPFTMPFAMVHYTKQLFSAKTDTK